MQFQNFLCYGQTKTGSRRVGSAALVHSEKRVKQMRQFIRRNQIATILKIDRDCINRLLCGDCNVIIRLAICYGIFQKVLKSPCQLFRISIDNDIIIHIKQQLFVVRVKPRIIFFSHLKKHTIQIDRRFLQRNVMEVISIL